MRSIRNGEFGEIASDIPFVRGEATYTLGLVFYQHVAKVFDDGERRKNMRLGI